MSSRRRWDAHCKRGHIAVFPRIRPHGSCGPRAIDVIRREKVFRGKEAEIARLIEGAGSSTVGVMSFSENEIADDRLRMMFVCCHPVIPPEAQVALALKTLCAFSVTEISRAFLTTEAAIAKRLTRAKQ